MSERPAEPRDAGAQALDRLAERVRRVEQQLQAFRELHVAEVGALAEKLAALVTLHADELRLALDELHDIALELEARRAPPASTDDPAAASPKRARWLAAEEERRARAEHLSRRDLLVGRKDERAADEGPPERSGPGVSETSGSDPGRAR